MSQEPSTQSSVPVWAAAYVICVIFCALLFCNGLRFMHPPIDVKPIEITAPPVCDVADTVNPNAVAEEPAQSQGLRECVVVFVGAGQTSEQARTRVNSMKQGVPSECIIFDKCIEVQKGVWVCRVMAKVNPPGFDPITGLDSPENKSLIKY